MPARESVTKIRIIIDLLDSGAVPFFSHPLDCTPDRDFYLFQNFLGGLLFTLTLLRVQESRIAYIGNIISSAVILDSDNLGKYWRQSCPLSLRASNTSELP